MKESVSKFLAKKNFQIMLGRKRLRQGILSPTVRWTVLDRWMFRLFRWLDCLQNLRRIILSITQNEKVCALKTASYFHAF